MNDPVAEHPEAATEPAVAPEERPEESPAEVKGRARSGVRVPAVRAEKKVKTGLWDRLRALGAFLARSYATADPRSLGLFRIALGTLLFVDVARRVPDLAAHYANTGWLSNHFSLFRPMSSHLFSVYHAFSTLEEVRVLAVFHLLVNFFLIIGYKTRLMHVLAAVLITSINSRVILIENGGWVVLNLLTVWTMFLPLGRRFSVDAFLRSWRERREGTLSALNDRSAPVPSASPVVSLAVTALILQWAAIYYFNTVHKNGVPWKDGTAVYYFFQQDRMVTDLGAFIRDHLPLGVMKMMTWSTLAIEGTLVLLLLSPFATGVLRMIAWGLVVLLHLSIDAVVQLGPFSWAMMIMLAALVPGGAWERLRLRALRRAARRIVYVDSGSGVSLTIARVVKRLDRLERVRFLEREGLSTLVVAEEGGSREFTGTEAVVRLCDAFVVPSWLFLGVRLPGIRQLGDALLKRLHAPKVQTTDYFELQALPGTDRLAPPPSAARLAVGRVFRYAGQLAVLVLILAAASQVLIENRAVPERFKPHDRPEWMTALVVYPRLFQGWSMFAPQPPNDDGRLVVDGRTADGRRIDPLTGQEPSFDVQPPGGFRMNQIWGDWHRRIAEPRFRVYLQGVKDMLLRYHEISGRPQDRIVAFDLWFVSEQIPPPGMPKAPPQRRKILSHGKMR